MRSFVLAAAVAAALATSACIQPSLVECAGGFSCSDTQACDEAHAQCVDPAQISACDGVAANAACSVGTITGYCVAGVCLASECGDGIIEPPEVCDDGNHVGGDGCSADCLSTEVCGNGILDPEVGETCDDGNHMAHDGCDSTCHLENEAWTIAPLAPYCVSGAYDVGGDRYVCVTAESTWALAGDHWAIVTSDLPVGLAATGVNVIYDSDRAEIGAVTLTDGQRWTLHAGAWESVGDPLGSAVVISLYDSDAKQTVAFTENESVVTQATGGAWEPTTAPASPAYSNTPGLSASYDSTHHRYVISGSFLNVSCYCGDYCGCDPGVIAYTLPHASWQPGERWSEVDVIASTTDDGNSTEAGAAVAYSTALGQVVMSMVHDGLWRLGAHARVRRIDTTGTIATIAGDGYLGYAGDGGLATAADLDAQYIAATPSGGLVIASQSTGAPTSNVIREVSATGVITTIAGKVGDQPPSPGGVGDNGPASEAFVAPSSLAVDGAGNIYFGEYCRIRKISTTGTITTIAGGNTCSQGALPANGIPATSALLSQITQMVTDPAGNLYFTNAGYTVAKVTTANVYSTVAGNGEFGNTGDGGQATQAAIEVNGLGIDAAGNLYISTYDQTIRKVTASSGVITTIAGGAPSCLPGDGSAAAVCLGGFQAIAVAPSGTVEFVETDANQFRLRKLASGTVSTLAAWTTAGDAGDGGPVSAAQFGPVTQLAFDSAGELLVADTGIDAVPVVAKTDFSLANLVDNPTTGELMSIYPSYVVSLVSGQWSVRGLDQPADLQLAEAPTAGGVLGYELIAPGGGSNQFSRTWTWDGAWHLATATPAPGPRTGTGLAFDWQRRANVLTGGVKPPDFTGFTATPSTSYADTFTTDGATWTQLVGSGGGAAGSGAATDVLAFDPSAPGLQLGTATELASAGSSWQADGSGGPTLTSLAYDAKSTTMFGVDASSHVYQRATSSGSGTGSGSASTSAWQLSSLSPTDSGYQVLADDRRGWLAFVPIGGVGVDTFVHHDGALLPGAALPQPMSGHAAYDPVHGTIVAVGVMPALGYAATVVRTLTSGAADETCVAGEDADHDGLSGCADPDCFWSCASCPPFASCP